MSEFRHCSICGGSFIGIGNVCPGCEDALSREPLEIRMKKAKRTECGGCRHWRADVVDAFGRPAQEETKAFCVYHGTTTDRDDWCKHHEEADHD